MSAERAITFECAGSELVGILHSGAATAEVGIVFVVGGPQYRVGSHRQFTLMARTLAKQGFPVLRFDYRGMGDSSGEFRGFEDCSVDIRVAIDVMMRELPSLRSVALFGLCDGASAALMHSVADARVNRLILANPWVRTASTQAATYLKHYYWKRPFQRSFWAKLGKGGFDLRKSIADFAGSLRRAYSRSAAPITEKEPFVSRMLKALRAFDHPVLMLISEQDLTAKEFCGVCDSDGQWRAAIARQNVTRHDLAGADHTFSVRASLEAATQACIDWLRADVRRSVNKVA